VNGVISCRKFLVCVWIAPVLHYLLTTHLGACENVFKPGSASPAAILLDALELYEKKSPRADELIRSIRPELGRAVDTLVEAAGQEIEPYWQKRLLNV
jgi:hypothetical protein